MAIVPFMMESGNPAPGGQGTDSDHIHHTLHPLTFAYGYTYSHSTPIRRQDGSVYIHHTYKRAGHNIGLVSGSLVWDTSCGTASGHSHQGHGGPELGAHLKSKARRYQALKI